MKAIPSRPVALFLAAVFPLLFCSCATDWRVADSVRPELPREAVFNQGAGRGDHLFLTLRSEDGEEMLFLVDTGAYITILDESLAGRLGKPIGTQRLRYEFFKHATGKKFKAPALFLGETRLRMGPTVVTDDLTRIAPCRPVMGILGMDCLRHYCLQLDFAAGKMRFLDPDRETNDLGVAIPLEDSSGAVMFRERGFGGKNVRFILDTGSYDDGSLNPRLFRRVLQQQRAIWTNQYSTGARLWQSAWFTEGELCGNSYTNLLLDEFSGKMWWSENLLGLRFLARHVVTLNFPKRTMHLDRPSAAPLPPKGAVTHGATLDWFDDLPAVIDQSDLAARFLTAPNLRPANEMPWAYRWARARPEFLRLRLSVGQPGTRLSVAHLPPADYPLKFVSKTERGTNGEARAAFEYLPETNRLARPLKQKGTIILLHDYNAQKEAMTWWAYLLAEAGYRAVLVDLRGHGESTGQTVSYGKQETEDLRQLLDHLTQRHLSDERVGVLGLGYGAHLAMQWAARDARVRSVVVMSPYDRQEQMFERLAQDKKIPVSKAVLRDALATVTAKLAIDWDEWSAETALRRLTSPVLFISSGKKSLASTNEMAALQQAAPAGSKSLVIQEATRYRLQHWFHEIEPPIKAWFDENLMAVPVDSSGRAGPSKN